MKLQVIRCDVYSRVVGYYRPVQDWNRGKQEEYTNRYQMKPGDLQGKEEKE